MNKEEILEKSRRDGGVLDERERQQTWREARIMMAVVTITSSALLLWDTLHGISNPELVAVFMAAPMTQCYLHYRRTREKTYLVVSILGFVGIAIGLANYLMETM